MHLFRWARFLTWKRRRPSTPRQSSRWLLRHFHRSGSSRASLNAPSLSSLLVSSTFDLRPSVIYIEPASESGLRASQDEEDRKLIEDFHRSTAAAAAAPRNHGPLSPTGSQSSNAALARVSSLFHTTGRATILDRASIANLFNQLQFEMPPLPMEPAPPDDTAIAGTHGPTSPASATTTTPTTTKKKKTRAQKRLAKRKLKKMRAAAASASCVPAASEPLPPSETEALLANTEPGFFRQYMLRAKSKHILSAPAAADAANANGPKLRPLTSAECRIYLPSVALDPSTIGSRGDLSPPASPDAYEPIDFLLFGGCSEENPHRLREVDAEPRRYRARFVADQPAPSCTASIPIKPTLVRGLPPVFEPRFEAMYI